MKTQLSEFKLQEPVGTLISDPYEGHTFVPTDDVWPFSEPLYTETQVREMLADYKNFLASQKSGD